MGKVGIEEMERPRCDSQGESSYEVLERKRERAKLKSQVTQGVRPIRVPRSLSLCLGGLSSSRPVMVWLQAAAPGTQRGGLHESCGFMRSHWSFYDQVAPSTAQCSTRQQPESTGFRVH